MPDNQQSIDRLSQDARIKGAGRIIPDNTLPGNVTPEMLAAVTAALSAYRDRRGLDWKEISKAAGIDSWNISRMRNGHFPPGWQSHAIDLDHWLEDEIKRENAPKPSEFVMTRVAEEIYTVAQVVVTLKCIGIVYGWSGLGKTLALTALKAEKPGTVFISVQTAAATAMGVLLAVGKGLGIRDCYCLSQRLLMARIVELLSGTPRLLIVDEIHKLAEGKDDKALHVLRDLFDATGSPQLWSGTIDMVAYLERRQAGGHEPLSQIRRRIGIARDFTERAGGGDGGQGKPLFSTDEIRAVFARNKMRLAPDAVRYLMILANIPDSGGLGICRNLVIMATKVNDRDGAEVLTGEMLKNVHSLLVSRRDFSTLANRMQQQAATPVRAAAADRKSPAARKPSIVREEPRMATDEFVLPFPLKAEDMVPFHRLLVAEGSTEEKAHRWLKRHRYSFSLEAVAAYRSRIQSHVAIVLASARGSDDATKDLIRRAGNANRAGVLPLYLHYVRFLSEIIMATRRGR